MTWGTTTRYQFMSGAWMLVAPVYENKTVRDSIYLPEGIWIDYWDGTSHQGPKFLHGYPTPIDTIPVLVKAGAIIPMWPEMLYDGEYPIDTLILEIYPHQQSTFTIYEDDGSTRAYRQGAFATTAVSVSGPDYGTRDDVTIHIGPAEGNYEGQVTERSHWLEVHYPGKPDVVRYNDVPLDTAGSLSALHGKPQGWYYDPLYKSGVLFVKIQKAGITTSKIIEIRMSEGIEEDQSNTQLKLYPNPASAEVKIEWKGEKPWTVEVTDSTGKVVMGPVEYPARRHEAILEVFVLPAGVYQVTVISDGKTITQKLVIR